MAQVHEQILAAPAIPQVDCPLFGILPAEVRSHIFALALSDYEEPLLEKHYQSNTCFTRPTYLAPRKSDTELLRTCRAVYAECWFLPFVLKEQIHWLSSPNRAPPEYSVWDSHNDLANSLERITAQQGVDGVEINGLRVFAQMFRLEEGALESLLSTPGLNPRSLTLTIRHADWWYWEEDEPLRFEAGWLKGVSRCLPSSVREVHIELESVERKKGQVDAIAKQMCQKWFFKRSDGVGLYADSAGRGNEITRWRGTSTWHNQRWTRDESSPGTIDYYVVDVGFRLEHVVERRGGAVSQAAKNAAERGVFSDSELRLHLPEETAMQCRKPFVRIA